MLGKTEGSRRRGRRSVSWIGHLKEARGLRLPELSRAVGDRALWPPLSHRVARGRSRLGGTEHTSSHNCRATRALRERALRCLFPVPLGTGPGSPQAQGKEAAAERETTRDVNSRPLDVYKPSSWRCSGVFKG